MEICGRRPAINKETLMRTKMAVVLCLVGTLLTVGPAWAHHAFAAEFDANAPIKLSGTINKVEMINPHAWIHVDVKNQDGSTTTWMIEGGSPNTLFRRGLNRDTLPKGTAVVVEGYRAKDGSNRANGRDITLSDGKKLFVGSGGDAPGAPK